MSYTKNVLEILHHYTIGRNMRMHLDGSGNIGVSSFMNELY